MGLIGRVLNTKSTKEALRHKEIGSRRKARRRGGGKAYPQIRQTAGGQVAARARGSAPIRLAALAQGKLCGAERVDGRESKRPRLGHDWRGRGGQVEQIEQIEQEGQNGGRAVAMPDLAWEGTGQGRGVWSAKGIVGLIRSLSPILFT